MCVCVDTVANRFKLPSFEQAGLGHCERPDARVSQQLVCLGSPELKMIAGKL